MLFPSWVNQWNRLLGHDDAPLHVNCGMIPAMALADAELLSKVSWIPSRNLSRFVKENGGLGSPDVGVTLYPAIHSHGAKLLQVPDPKSFGARLATTLRLPRALYKSADVVAEVPANGTEVVARRVTPRPAAPSPAVPAEQGPRAPRESRIRNLKPMGDGLASMADELEGGRISKGLLKNVLQTLDNTQRTLDRTAKSADEMSRAGNGDAAELAVSLRSAAENLRGVGEALAERMPSFPRRLTLPAGTLDPLRTVASQVLHAEEAASRLSGPGRFEFDMEEPASRTIPSLEEAHAEDNELLRQALATQPQRVQEILRRVAPKLQGALRGSVQVTGADRLPEGPFILAPNHVTVEDTNLLLWCATEGTGITLRTMAKVDPSADRLAKAVRIPAGFVPMRSTGSAEATLATEKALIGQGHVANIFPEGAWVKTAGTGVMFDGAARLSLDTQVPVVPLSIYGTKASHREGVRRGGVVLAFGDPVSPGGAPVGPNNIGVQRDRIEQAMLKTNDEAADTYNRKNRSSR
jgi:1-acyl-sn-glycerol-3-phosphate acyltransferase